MWQPGPSMSAPSDDTTEEDDRNSSAGPVNWREKLHAHHSTATHQEAFSSSMPLRQSASVSHNDLTNSTVKPVSTPALTLQFY